MKTSNSNPAFKPALSNFFASMVRSIIAPGWQTVSGPAAEPKLVSLYHADVYGRPRVLSRPEVILHAMARPVIIGVALGFAVAIAMLAHHQSSPESHLTTDHVRVAPPEANS